MLQKVNIIGDKYYHAFLKEGSTIEYCEVEITQQEYEDLALPGAGSPAVPKGFTWSHSGCRKKFDTPSGDLEDGQYADYLMRMAKPEGKHIVQAEAVHIDESGVDESKVPLREDESVKLEAPIASEVIET